VQKLAFRPHKSPRLVLQQRRHGCVENGADVGGTDGSVGAFVVLLDCFEPADVVVSVGDNVYVQDAGIGGSGEFGEMRNGCGGILGRRKPEYSNSCEKNTLDKDEGRRDAICGAHSNHLDTHPERSNRHRIGIQFDLAF